MRRVLTLAIIFAFTAVPVLARDKAAHQQSDIDHDRANIAGIQADKARIDASNESAARIAHRDQKFDNAIDNLDHKIAGELRACPTCH